MGRSIHISCLPGPFAPRLGRRSRRSSRRWAAPRLRESGPRRDRCLPRPTARGGAATGLIRRWGWRPFSRSADPADRRTRRSDQNLYPRGITRPLSHVSADQSSDPCHTALRSTNSATQAEASGPCRCRKRARKRAHRPNRPPAASRQNFLRSAWVSASVCCELVCCRCRTLSRAVRPNRRPMRSWTRRARVSLEICGSRRRTASARSCMCAQRSGPQEQDV